ncbi:hypothetical protein [Kosakonia sp. YIM B13611]|uniref:hypothetical protein n=1 Tax=unclassified Kosakonia TaxID=2632876 RepID=UPI003685A6BA
MASKIDRIIYAIGVFVMAVIFFIIIWSCATKKNDLSNWIIAIANVVMAIAAVAAALAARRYLAEFFYTKGFELAIKLINENLVELSMKNKLMEVAGVVYIRYLGLDNRIPDRKDRLPIKATMELFRNLNERHSQILNDCERLSIQMLSYGIVAVDSRKEALNSMLTSLQECITHANNIELILMRDVERYEKCLKDDMLSTLPFHLRDEDKEEMKTLLDGVIAHWNVMVNSYIEFFAKNRHVQSLFCIKKDIEFGEK